jgi:exonuclease VII small subunit
MDKSKVIAAYRRGFLTVRECGQILGIEELQLQSLLAVEEGRTGSLSSAQGNRQVETGS